VSLADAAALGDAEGVARQLIAQIAPSASVLGVGVDAVDLERFGRVIGRRSRMTERLFTAGERSYIDSATDPIPRMSTRFAAKEATMKALGVGLGAFPFVDVEVVRHALGAPHLVLHRSAFQLAGDAGVERWHLSLTHTDRVAVAFVVAEGSPVVQAGAGGTTGGDAVPVSRAPKP
jgi:holo-[acyl-carrier protein] synthase